MPESELREENKVKGKGGDGKGPDFPIKKILSGKQMGEEQKGLTLLPSSGHSGRGPAASRVSWERPTIPHNSKSQWRPGALSWYLHHRGKVGGGEAKRKIKRE